MLTSALSLCAPDWQPKTVTHMRHPLLLFKDDRIACDNRLPVQCRRLRSLRHRIALSSRSPRKCRYPRLLTPCSKPIPANVEGEDSPPTLRKHLLERMPKNNVKRVTSPDSPPKWVNLEKSLVYSVFFFAFAP